MIDKEKIRILTEESIDRIDKENARLREEKIAEIEYRITEAAKNGKWEVRIPKLLSQRDNVYVIKLFEEFTVDDSMFGDWLISWS